MIAVRLSQWSLSLELILAPADNLYKHVQVTISISAGYMQCVSLYNMNYFVLEVIMANSYWLRAYYDLCSMCKEI